MSYRIHLFFSSDKGFVLCKRQFYSFGVSVHVHVHAHPPPRCCRGEIARGLGCDLFVYEFLTTYVSCQPRGMYDIYVCRYCCTSAAVYRCTNLHSAAGAVVRCLVLFRSLVLHAALFLRGYVLVIFSKSFAASANAAVIFRNGERERAWSARHRRGGWSSRADERTEAAYIYMYIDGARLVLDNQHPTRLRGF